MGDRSIKRGIMEDYKGIGPLREGLGKTSKGDVH